MAQKYIVQGTQSDSSSQTCYTSIAFDERVTFGFNASSHYLVQVRKLHYLCVGSCKIITQSHTHTMQQTYRHKAVTSHKKPKNYSLIDRSIAQLIKTSKEVYLQMGAGGRVR